MIRHKQGSILIGTLWVLLILSLIAWGLSRRSALEVSLLETYQGKMRSYAAARAGLNTVLDFLQRTPSTTDTLFSCGIKIPDGKIPKDLFSHIDVGDGAYASVEWKAQGFSGDNKPHTVYGLRDEQGKININASNDQIMSTLLQLKGVPQLQANTLAAAISRFRGPGNSQGSNFSLKDDNDTDSLKPKQKPYENLMELLEVSGMTKDIFDKIKDDITVYGDNTQPRLSVNLNTANNDIIQVLAAVSSPGDSSTASTIVTQAYAIRDGIDGQSFTKDDGAGTATVNLPVELSGAGKSSYFRARVVGVDEATGVQTVLEAVIQNGQGSTHNPIKEWLRD